MRMVPVLLALWASPALAQAPVIHAVTPRSGAPGTVVKIIGERLDQVTDVDFNGRAASFRVVSDLHVKAVVPPDATSGPITVSNDHGTGASPQIFIVATGVATAASQWGPPRPNPGSDHVSWTLALGRDAPVRIEICDANGRRVRALMSRDLPAGRYELTWDLRDDRGRRVPSGMYPVRLAAGTIVRTSRIAVVR